MLSNNGLSQPGLYSDATLTPHRTRATSASSSTSAPVISSHYSAFPQPYQPVGPMESSWTHPQGVYVNGLGKIMNVFPTGTVSELDDLLVGQPIEPYKYAQSMKQPTMGQQSTGPVFQRSPDLASGAHGTMPAPLQVAIAAGAPGVSQSQNCAQPVANSLRMEPSNMLHSSVPHQQISNATHSLLISGLVGQHGIQHHHHGIASSALADSAILGANMHAINSYNMKQISPLNGLNNARVMTNHLSGTQTPLVSQNCAQGLPVVQHPPVSHPPQLYSAPNIQQPTPPPTHLPPPVMEFLPPMYSTDPNAQVQFNQTSSAMFGQYAPYLHGTYENPSVPLDARVRHNTWSGLESGVPIGTLDHQDKGQAAGHPASGLNRAIPQRGYALDAFASNFSSCSVYTSNPVTPVFSSGIHRSNIMEPPVPSGLDNGNSQSQREVNSLSCGSPHFSKTNKHHLRGNGRSQWNTGVVRQPIPWNSQPSVENPPGTVRMLNAGSVTDTNLSSTVPAQRRPTQHDQSNRSGSRKGRDIYSYSGAEQQHAVDSRQAFECGMVRAKYPQTSANQNIRSCSYPNYPYSFHARPPLAETNGARTQSRVPVCSTTNFHNTFDPRWNLQSGSPLDTSSFRTTNHTFWRHQAFPLTVSPPTFESGEPRHPRGLPQSPHYIESPGAYYLPRYDNAIFSSISSKSNGLRCLLDALPTRILISTALVGAIIGKGGRTIRSITSKTGTKIDFKSETVVFSQFSHPAGLRQPPKPPRLGDQSIAESTKKTDGDSLARATPSPPPATANGLQLDQSQVVFLSGPREQCSAALADMLAVCFRECEHKGLADPCLGLLIQQQLYTRSLIGRKFFNSVNACTGARVAVTGSPVKIHMNNAESDSAPSTSKKQPKEINLDRILVIRGQLSAILDAEACISEQVRLHTAKLLVPPTIWPLFPHLPLNALIPSSLRSKTSSDDWQCDLSTVNSLILAIAEVFWPHSVSSRLSKHVPIHQSSPSHAVSSSVGNSSATKSTSESDGPHEPSPSSEDANLVSTTTSEGVEAESEKPASTVETRSASPSNPLPEPEQVENTSDATPSSTNEVPSSNGSTHPHIGGTHAENDPSTSQPSPDTSENDSSEKPAKLSDNTCSGPPRSFPMNNRDLAFATAVQQSLVATVSPAAWLATSGVLYMRVSSNEAGLLIGAGGYRIHQLMQSTGAEIHIGKTPIHEPYALNQANRKAPGSYPDKAVSSLNTPTTPSEVPPESSVPVSNESPSLTDETSQQHEPSDYPSLGSFVTSDSNGLVYPGDNAVDSSSVHSSTDTSEQHYTSEPGLSTIAHTGADNSDSPLAELLEDAATNSVTGDTVESQTLKATPPASPDSLKPTPPPHSTAGSYRLVSLSGPLQAQLLAQWRIFQRLKALHQKNHAEVENADSTEGHAKPAGSSPSTPFRLATLVCLPYRFLCWMTSSNSGFADFMCTTSSSPTLSSTHPTILHAESSSPLSWLQAQAALRMRHSTETQPAIEKAIHILPEPRRRRRLLQLQLRRSGTTRRGQSATHFNRHIVLPSVGLANDGLDLLWADPNRIPMEIYADHETTQLVLAHLHHMLALWLYGQALANLTGFGINQALSLYMVPPSLMRPHSLNQPGRLVDSRAVEATTGPPPMPSIGALGDWTPHWPRSPSPLDTFMRFHPAMHPSQMNRFPTHYGRLQRIRMPGFGNRWRTPQNDPSVAHHDPSGLERMVTYPSANHMRPFAATHPYTASAFAPFPGCAPQDTLLAQTHGICVPSPESFPRTAANLMPQCSGSQFEPSWHTLPPSSQSHFGWDQTSYLSRLTYESSRRHPPTRSNRKSTNASEPPASSASKHSVSTNADKESSVDPDISS